MKHNQKLAMIRAMRLFGGSFVSALAECFTRADSINTLILENAFPKYCEEYLKMAREEKNRLNIDFNIDAGE